jgi:catechol-2,3-dioxygenase
MSDLAIPTSRPVDAPAKAAGPVKPKYAVEPLNRPKVLSHGTLECRDMAATRRFYQEFLGLECVRHSQRSFKFRLGEYFSVVCLQRGDRAKATVVGNHWGLDLPSKADVDRAHKLAHEYQEKYKIGQITKIVENETYGFYFTDLDGNWWEFQYAGEGQCEGWGRNDEHFESGDITQPAEPPRASK